MQKLIEGERQEALECLRDLWTEEKKPEIRARLFGLASGLYLPKKNALFGFRFLPDKQLTFEGKPCLSISILEVVRNSPAEGARLQKGDLILGIGDALLAPGSSLDDILIFFKRQPLGKKRKMRVRRQEKDLIIPVLPGEQDLTKEEQRFFERKFLKWLLTVRRVRPRPRRLIQTSGSKLAKASLFKDHCSVTGSGPGTTSGTGKVFCQAWSW
jgi:hypothetical protein